MNSTATASVPSISVNDALKIVLPCGRHEGDTLGDVVGTDLGYLDHLIDAAWLDAGLRAAVEVLWRRYERQIDQLAR